MPMGSIRMVPILCSSPKAYVQFSATLLRVVHLVTAPMSPVFYQLNNPHTIFFSCIYYLNYLFTIFKSVSNLRSLSKFLPLLVFPIPHTI